MSLATCCVKYTLFIFNLFFVLAGATLIGMGLAVQLKVTPVMDHMQDTTSYVAPWGTMALGALVFIVAFLGCCGSIKNSHCMLVSYAVILVILMIAMVAVAITVFVDKEDVVKEVPKALYTLFQREDRTEFHVVENALKCCGTDGVGSYIGGAVPPSCCPDHNNCDAGNAFAGCISVTQGFVRTFSTVIGCISLVVASVMLVAVVLSLCLANQARNDQRRSRY